MERQETLLDGALESLTLYGMPVNHRASPVECAEHESRVPLGSPRGLLRSSCHHQQPRHSNHHHRPPKLTPPGSILSSALLLRIHRQRSLTQLLLQRPLRHRPVCESLYTSPFPVRLRQTAPTASLFRCRSLSPVPLYYLPNSSPALIPPSESDIPPLQPPFAVQVPDRKRLIYNSAKFARLDTLSQQLKTGTAGFWYTPRWQE